MSTKWTDEKITEALKAAARDPNVLPWADRVWDRIETRLSRRHQEGFWKRAWVWVRPYRAALVAACFCALVAGTVTYQHSADQVELGSYLLNVSDPRVEVPENLGVVPTSVLLSEGGDSISAKDLGTVSVPVFLEEDGASYPRGSNFSETNEDEALLQI
ncbi:MAG: hypothetical protein ACREL1_04710 [bacterium]